MQILEIFSDGGSRGNPGPAAIGAVIRGINKETKKNQDLKEISEFIGVATNNVAEYTAVIRALEWVENNIKDEMSVDFFLDSQLVVEQLNGNYKMKNEGLKPLFWEIKGLIMGIGCKVSFTHIPREENKEADALVNKALDGELKGKNV